MLSDSVWKEVKSQENELVVGRGERGQCISDDQSMWL